MIALDLMDPGVQAALLIAAVVLGALLGRAWGGAGLAQGQALLAQGLTQLAQAQAESQARLAQGLDQRLGEMRGEVLGTQTRAAQAYGALEARLAALDRAQTRIERLSGDMLGLQALLSNKQARGAFGEIQLAEIVGNALPPGAYTLQATLGSGRRVDCLIHLPHPPGPIAIDAKFPLEAYEALIAATDAPARAAAGRALRAAVQGHLRDIAERYIVPGETADQALMFLPSEAVYAELHAHHAQVVRAGFAMRVWIVSPATTMAVLTALRAVLRDAAIQAEGARIRAELAALSADLGRLGTRAAALERHFAAAGEDLAALRVSAAKAGQRGARLEAADWGDSAPLGKAASGG